MLSACDGVAAGQRMSSELMADWGMRELRLFIARLRGLGFMVTVGPRPRRQYLEATIISAHTGKGPGLPPSEDTGQVVCAPVFLIAPDLLATPWLLSSGDPGQGECPSTSASYSPRLPSRAQRRTELSAETRLSPRHGARSTAHGALRGEGEIIGCCSRIPQKNAHTQHTHLLVSVTSSYHTANIS